MSQAMQSRLWIASFSVIFFFFSFFFLVEMISFRVQSFFIISSQLFVGHCSDSPYRVNLRNTITTCIDLCLIQKPFSLRIKAKSSWSQRATALSYLLEHSAPTLSFFQFLRFCIGSIERTFSLTVTTDEETLNQTRRQEVRSTEI